jgi:Tol biopolymer transport system component
VVPIDGGKIAQLTFDQGQSRSAAFSPDNEWIAFAGERGGVWNIHTVSRRTNEVNQITNFTTTDHVIYPAWSPRGNRIAFERSTRKASLWTVRLPSGMKPGGFNQPS